MKKAARVAWSVSVITLMVSLFFFLLVNPARAPHGGKKALGGRTIASLQEEEFDRRMLEMQYCYGIRFSAADATLQRRRVCKALVVHELEKAFSKPGVFLKHPLEFQCVDTVFGKKLSKAEGAQVVLLKPNSEHESITQAIESALTDASVSESADQKARNACHFLADCKWATRPGYFSFRKLASCLTTEEIAHREILLDEVAAMIFGVKEEKKKILYTELVQKAAN